MDAPTTAPIEQDEGPVEGPVVSDPTAEERRQRLDEQRQSDEATDAASTARSAVKTAAELGGGRQRGELTPEAQKAALDWFLSDEEMPMEQELDIDIGPPTRPYPYKWTITAISSETLKRIRSQAQEGNRGRRRAAAQQGLPPEVDENEANLRIVVAGTVKPDLRDYASRRGAPEHPDPDFAALQLLQHRLRHKPGLIDQIAGKILLLSGYDDEDIREHEAGKA